MLPDYEIYEINWPGRGSRLKDGLVTNATTLAEQCAAALWPALEDGRPFAFLGFAFGAIIALEVARVIQSKSPGDGPMCLVAVSCEGPSWDGRRTGLHKLGAPAFEEMLKEKGGTDFILKDAGMKRQYLPVIKADLQLEEGYLWTSAPLLRCPVLAVHGKLPGRDKEKSEVTVLQ